jgi:hypothetical protein
MSLTGKTIGELTFLAEPTNNTLIPVSTPTNTFVFGIQNNTAGNVTVNYGFLKI